MAPPKGPAKSKAQDLQRIRANQQRSRDRRKAYIAELEARVRVLNEKVRVLGEGMERAAAPLEAGEREVRRENEARRELLKVLGVGEEAQRQFVRAFARRGEVGLGGMKVQEGPGEGRELREEAGLRTPDDATAEDWTTETSSTWHSAEPGIVQQPPEGPSNEIKDVSAVIPAEPSTSLVQPTTASESQALAKIPQTPSTLSLAPSEQQAVFTPCLWNACGQVSASSSESTTGCSIAFSMLLSNNSRGYTFADLDARLQAAYRQDASVAEGCSVPTKVLFQLLSEIS